jgi:hypothetical protein
LCPADPGPIRRHALFFIASAPKNLTTPKPGIGSQLLGSTGFADARFTDESDQPSLARKGVFQAGFQVTHLFLPAYEDTTGQAVQGVGRIIR